MGSDDNIHDLNAWRKHSIYCNHEIRVLDVNINSLKIELIKVINLPVLPKYLDDKKEDLIRYQREKQVLMKIIRALKRNMKGVENKSWYQSQNTILKKSRNS